VKKTHDNLFKRSLIVIGLFTLFVTLACSFFSFATVDRRETSSVLEMQQTQLANTVAALTMEAYPKATITIPVIISDTLEPRSILEQTPIPDLTQENLENFDYERILERRMRAAKILLFEDMSGSRQIRFVKEALDQAGYYYLDVGSAKGWFKSQLLSNQKWDLIIAAAEARRPFGGEYFEYINDQIIQGNAAIVEFWDMNSAPNGKIKPFLDQCGIEYDGDWYEPDMRTFFWLRPGDPLLTAPNQIGNYLHNAEPLWFGDVGDLIKIKKRNGVQIGDASLVAGLNGAWKEDHGVLARCIEGRVIYQSFSSHEYVFEDMIPLWQNYVYNTLLAKIEGTNVITKFIMGDNLIADRQMNPTPIFHQAETGKLGEEFTCGGIIQGNVPREPKYIKDMFEHHAEGIYAILEVELKNISEYPIQIFDGDYTLTGQLGDVIKNYKLDKAATDYLFIESPKNLSQDLILPSTIYKTSLAFDVDEGVTDLRLIISPGEEERIPLCRVEISILE